MTLSSAVFLDLQGTLGGDGLGNILDFEFFPQAIPAIQLLNSSGLPAIVVTNQSQIGRGVLTYAQYLQRVDELQVILAKNHAHLDAFYCCPHTKAQGCDCCKPLPGLLLQAQKDFQLDLATCYMVGDTGAWDMLLAKAIGCHSVLVRTGLGESSLGEYRHTWAGFEADFIAVDVLEAAQWIVKKEFGGSDLNPKGLKDL
jgi:D-glycero-D-manno-heptose 1,7-bisphosphate phosphatase